LTLALARTGLPSDFGLELVGETLGRLGLGLGGAALDGNPPKGGEPLMIAAHLTDPCTLPLPTPMRAVEPLAAYLLPRFATCRQLSGVPC
jgi:hypothetical protein